METITITIPRKWLNNAELTPDQVRKALQLGLAQLEEAPVAPSKQAIKQAFIEAGLSISEPQSPAQARLSAERQAELAALFAEDGPLSELIIAEREEGP